MNKNPNSILLLVKVPPPLTGATLMNMYVVDSEKIKSKFNIRVIAVSYKKDIISKHDCFYNKLVKIIIVHYRLLKLLIMFNPKIVYFQVSPIGIAFIRDCSYIFWLKVFGKQIVYHLHGKGIKDASESSPLMRGLYRWAFKRTSIISLSRMLTDDITPVYAGVPYIVNNGIPIVPQYDVKIDGKESTPVRVLFLSNLLYSKGIIVFLDALMMLRWSCQNKISVQIVGKEAELSADMLVSEIEKRSIHHFVSYAGPKYGEEKNEIFRQTDIFVYPTLNDVWGLVILEAMQFGIPIIATREGAIPEIVDDGTTGFLVDKNSPAQIAEKLTQLIETPHLCRSMGNAGRTKFLERYTLSHFEESMKSVFENMLIYTR